MYMLLEIIYKTIKSDNSFRINVLGVNYFNYDDTNENWYYTQVLKNVIFTSRAYYSIIEPKVLEVMYEEYVISTMTILLKTYYIIHKFSKSLFSRQVLIIPFSNQKYKYTSIRSLARKSGPNVVTSCK